MSRFKRFEIVKRTPSYSIRETSISYPAKTLMLNHCFPSLPVIEDEFDCVSKILSFTPSASVCLDEFDTLSDLILMEEAPLYVPTRRVAHYLGFGYGTDLYLQSICDRVSDLELGLERLVKERRKKQNVGERNYSWTAEIKSPEKNGIDRKYKWTAEIKDGKGEKKGLEKNYKWSAEIKRKGGECGLPIERTYTVKVSSRDENHESEKEEKKKCEKLKGKSKSAGSTARIVEIEDPSDHGAVVLREVFHKRLEKNKGKRRMLSPQDAATLIQISFKAYLIRRSQALRALRELAIAKTKLKELRVLFNNFSYRRRLTRDAEERQRFSEKIIVLLLTVDAIEGADRMVRAAKKSMVDELEAMLDVIDPQPAGKTLLARRTFDMPDGIISKELAAGVAQVVQMLDQDAIASGSEALEA